MQVRSMRQRHKRAMSETSRRAGLSERQIERRYSHEAGKRRAREQQQAQHAYPAKGASRRLRQTPASPRPRQGHVTFVVWTPASRRQPRERGSGRKANRSVRRHNEAEQRKTENRETEVHHAPHADDASTGAGLHLRADDHLEVPP